ncbi:hypothetical protein CRG98_002694 [Punica granatum]|uniref:Uncharacterized protein n=1 Tax=Punica granatum TaxID=22663 RepID=A0A2I0L876_PUNGR|nr:hypothetical protein CRG98_002694 [Punica granatum]
MRRILHQLWCILNRLRYKLYHPQRLQAFHRGIRVLLQFTSHYRQYSNILTPVTPHNRASSRFTPPPEHRPTVDPNPVVPPTLASESEEVSFSAMMHVPAVYPVTDPFLPPPAPTAVPLPPVAFLSANFAVRALPPLAMPAQPPLYTVLPPTIPTTMNAPTPAYTVEHLPFQTSQPYMGLSYQALPPLNIPPLEPGTPI